MPRIAIALLLKGGDRRSIGRANHVAELVLRHPHRLRELLKCMWSGEAVVRMRAADAAEKISRQMPGPFRRFIPELLGLADETVEIELRWHLASIIPRLNLSSAQRLRAFARFREYLQDRSSIVKTFALQALADLADSEEKLRPEVADLLAQAPAPALPPCVLAPENLLSDGGWLRKRQQCWLRLNGVSGIERGLSRLNDFEQKTGSRCCS